MDKQHAHQLLDQLDPSQFDAVVRLLEIMTDHRDRLDPQCPHR